jgi:NADH dehydrogenase FAD-containing subunit
MFDARITIIDGKMTKFDRSNKTVYFIDKHGDNLTIDYDILVLTLGLVDKTTEDLKNGKTKVVECKSIF